MSEELIRKSEVLELFDIRDFYEDKDYLYYVESIQDMQSVNAVELPCKAGDVLYVTDYVDSEKSYIDKAKVSSIEFDEFGISIYCKTIEGTYDTYVPNDFGDNIFLSYEEAERVLEELRNERIY